MLKRSTRERRQDIEAALITNTCLHYTTKTQQVVEETYTVYLVDTKMPECNGSDLLR